MNLMNLSYFKKSNSCPVLGGIGMKLISYKKA